MRSLSSSRAARARVGVFAAAAVIVAGIFIPTASAAASPAPTPTPVPTRHAIAMGTYQASSYTAQAAHLPSGLDAAVNRDLKETPAQYLADSAAAAQAVKVVASLKSVGVQVRGSKINGTALTVYVASNADKAAVADSGATPVVGAPSGVDLSSHNLVTTAATPSYGGEGWFGQDQQDAQSNDGLGFRCSVGFNGYSPSNAAQFLTAGHCASVLYGNGQLLAQSAPSPANSQTNITGAVDIGAAVAGEAAYGNSSNADYGVVGEGSAVTAQASLATWGYAAGAPFSSSPLPILGQTAGIAGANVCKSGSTSGWTCGVILAVDDPTPVCPEAGDTDCPTDEINAIITTACVLPGDSGSGAVMGQLAVGVDSGGDFPSNSCSNPLAGTQNGHISAFFPMVSASGGASVSSELGSNWTLLTAPLVTSPLTGATVASNAAMTGTLASTQTGLSLALYLDGSSSAIGTTTGSATWSIPLSAVSQGAHTYSLVETLGGSQISTTTGSFVEAVTSVPTLSFPASSATVDSSSTMTGTISSPLPNSTALLYLDGSSNAFAQVPASSGSWSISLSGLSLGTHSYSLAAGVGAIAGASRVTGTLNVVAVNPQGSFDSATGVPGGIQISGWSLDASVPASTYVWVNVDGSGGPILANQALPWIASLYPNAGPNHGFASTLPASPGNHTVCVYGTNSKSLGCKSVSVPQNAQGSFDSAAGVPGGIQISGWSLDLSTTASTYVWVNVDGSGGPILANASLPWINALFPGEGTNHGFSSRLTASPGTHTVCIYGTNSILLGCKSVSVPQNAQGSFDSASGVPGGIQISGWSLDLTTSASTYVWVNVDGSGGPIIANASLPWINSLFPGEGTNHGFSSRLTASPGTHTVCVYGTNSILLGCKSVVVPQNAQGSFDSVTGGAGTLSISGWSLDLSTSASTYIWVNVDGSGGPVLANVSLPWIDSLFPGEGPNHGFAATLSASAGNHTVCVYGTNSIALGCKVVGVH